MTLASDFVVEEGDVTSDGDEEDEEDEEDGDDDAIVKKIFCEIFYCGDVPSQIKTGTLRVSYSSCTVPEVIPNLLRTPMCDKKNVSPYPVRIYHLRTDTAQGTLSTNSTTMKLFIHGYLINQDFSIFVLST
jgi:hypothetical protein